MVHETADEIDTNYRYRGLDDMVQSLKADKEKNGSHFEAEI